MDHNAFNSEFQKQLNDVFDAMEQNHNQDKQNVIKKKLIVVGKGAKKILEEYEEDILDFLDVLYVYKKTPQKQIKAFVQDADFVLLLAAVGGISGKKYVLEVANTLKKLGVFTIGITVEPLLIEGRQKIVAAEKTIEKLQEYVSCLVSIRDPEENLENENFDALNVKVVQTIYVINDSLDTASTFDHGIDKFKLMLEQAEVFKMHSIIIEQPTASIEQVIDVIEEASNLQLNLEDTKVAIVALYTGNLVNPEDIMEIEYSLELMLDEKAEIFLSAMVNEDITDGYEIHVLVSSYSNNSHNKPISNNTKKPRNNKVSLIQEQEQKNAVFNALTLSQLCINLLIEHNIVNKEDVLKQIEKIKNDLKKMYDTE